MEIKKFENSLIAFDFTVDIVNATDLLKAYNSNLKEGEKSKKMGDYNRLKQTKEFKEILELKTGIPVIGSTKGIEGGTWMNRLMAYDFAAWLSPKFRLFIYETFDSVIQDKLRKQQMQLDYFWDKEDQKDLYPRNKLY
jgi:hypothetical protein